EHLAETYEPDELSWAIAGRNRQKLDNLSRNLAGTYGEAGDVPVVLANAFDRPSLDAMADRTAVVCTTVGPYSTFGEDLVAACVDQQTDYCDLSGELPWIRRMQEAHHQEATERGVRIVNCCGFDSIPSDLGTYVLQKRARREYGAPCRQVKFVVERLRGDFSGG
ncbi:MAG: saccharopine dehydrogenase NADP-binding domain-containing protein, partial [Bradymonadaceae bacterium]